MTDSGPRWTGKILPVIDNWEEPLHWKKPRRIFVNSMSDLFHDGVEDWVIRKLFSVMARCPQHTFQILTKRPARMRNFFAYSLLDIGAAANERLTRTQLQLGMGVTCNWPLPNVWLGVSVEDQATADERIPMLLQTPAALRFISAEPLLGPVDLNRIPGENQCLWDVLAGRNLYNGRQVPRLNWVIVGGESGSGARPMHPDWARSLRNQCNSAGVPFFFKQWGEWLPGDQRSRHHDAFPEGSEFRRVGKKTAGRELDGTDWNQYPKVRDGKT